MSLVTIGLWCLLFWILVVLGLQELLFRVAI